ncbi:MAG TPA: bestrophin family ion channel [Saprospiraceae bacterium]|nr:bestrophin family ion channel [Saprospiraceae bacterium]HPI08830.1 bestrophin family ion channel [Saprospiraceae bacterium]
MIAHDPKTWLAPPFHFHRSDTLRRLFPWIIVMCCYAAFVAWLEIEYWRIGPDSHLRNVSIMHTLLGFVISFLLVFRTNTAYERWWEGRKLWGQLVNTSRNLAMKMAAILPEDSRHRTFFRKIIPLYANALKSHLRSEDTRIELFDNLPEHIVQKLDMEKHVPNQIAAFMFRHVQDMRNEQLLDGYQFMAINTELQSFTDICGGCERIKNTPIPYSYSVFIKKFIMTYVATLPFGLVFSLGYWIIPIVGFIFYVLASLEVIAEEIEEPFGADENDLPLSRMARSIEAHVQELI